MHKLFHDGEGMLLVSRLIWDQFYVFGGSSNSWVVADWSCSRSSCAGMRPTAAAFRRVEHCSKTRWKIDWLWWFSRSRRCQASSFLVHPRVIECNIHSRSDYLLFLQSPSKSRSWQSYSLFLLYLQTFGNICIIIISGQKTVYYGFPTTYQGNPNCKLNTHLVPIQRPVQTTIHTS